MSIGNKLVAVCAEGRLFQVFWSAVAKVWNMLWNELGRIVAIFTRWIMKLTIKPKPNKIFFHTQEIKYCCNPKYVMEEFRRQGYKDLEIVWRAPSKGTGGIPGGVKMTPINSYQYFKNIYESKIVITNSFLYLGQPFKLRKDQILLETWHGSLGIKKHDPKSIDTRRRLNALKQTGKMTSYFISNSTLENSSMHDTYWAKTPIVMLGHARNDILCPPHEEKRQKIRERLFREWGIDPNTKIIMYGPTFRNDYQISMFELDFDKAVGSIKAKFGGEWAVVLRYHPSIASKMGTGFMDSFTNRDYPVINATSHIDMQELIAVTDIAITDYSSWIYDFVLMRKPGFIFATDLKRYDQDRGFYYPIQETPFDICENNKQLIDAIDSFDEEEYLAKVEQFLIDKGCIDDGHSSERIVKFMRDLLDGKKPDPSEIY